MNPKITIETTIPLLTMVAEHCHSFFFIKNGVETSFFLIKCILNELKQNQNQFDTKTKV